MTIPGKETTVEIITEGEARTIRSNLSFTEGSAYTYRYDINMIQIGDRPFFSIGDELFDMVGGHPEALCDAYNYLDPYYYEKYTFTDLVELRKWFMSEKRVSVTLEGSDQHAFSQLFSGTNISLPDRYYLRPWIEANLDNGLLLVHHYERLIASPKLHPEGTYHDTVLKYIEVAGERTSLNVIPDKTLLKLFEETPNLVTPNMYHYGNFVVRMVIKGKLNKELLKGINDVGSDADGCLEYLNMDLFHSFKRKTVSIAFTANFLAYELYTGEYPVLPLRNSVTALYSLVHILGITATDLPVLTRKDLVIPYVSLTSRVVDRTSGLSNNLVQALVELSDCPTFKELLRGHWRTLVMLELPHSRADLQYARLNPDLIFSYITTEDKVELLSRVDDRGMSFELVRLAIDKENARSVAKLIIEGTKK